MSTLTDREIICKDCHRKFLFTARDQEFFTKMSFTPPVRCKPCRDKRKAEKEGGGAPAGRPLGTSPSNPIREYRSGSRTFSASPPPPSRDNKISDEDGRRRRGGGRRDRNQDADW